MTTSPSVPTTSVILVMRLVVIGIVFHTRRISTYILSPVMTIWLVVGKSPECSILMLAAYGLLTPAKVAARTSAQVSAASACDASKAQNAALDANGNFMALRSVWIAS